MTRMNGHRPGDNVRATANPIWAGFVCAMSSLQSSSADDATRLQEARARLDAQSLRIEALERALVQARSFEVMALLSGIVAHDFNNVLATVSGAMHLLKRSALDARSQDFVQRGQRGIERATPLIRQLVGFANAQPWLAQPWRLSSAIESGKARMQDAAGPQVRLVWEAVHDANVHVDARQLEWALTNLVLNAREAMPTGGDVHLATRDASAGTPWANEHTVGPWVAIVVRDDGVGMSAEVLAQACEPFFTTKGSDPCSGLGLAMVNAFAQRSGGRLLLDSTPGHGTKATLLLPCINANDATGHFGASTLG